MVTEFHGIEAVDHDGRRVGQLVSNLLTHAMTHGAGDLPVWIQARVARGVFELSVRNSCEPISTAVLERIFKPFGRGAIRPSQQGLGLYIASEIAQARRER